MMDPNINFDAIPQRRGTNAIKWQAFDPDVLPMWVADMDFASPPGVIAALQERVAHGIYGYPGENPDLIEAIRAWLLTRFSWSVPAESIVLLPGVVNGFNMAARLVDGQRDGVLIQTPVYPPFLATARLAGARSLEMELTNDGTGYYSVDLDRFQQTLEQGAGMFLLCNPHNPVGRVFRQEELLGMAEKCLENDVLIIADEIHADLVFRGHPHTPIASLMSEIANQTITLMAPSKTFNIAGLECAFAVITNEELRKRFKRAGRGLVGWVNLLGQTAALAAYMTGETWLDGLMAYLEGNRDQLVKVLQQEMPELRVSPPEGTYLAWIDCRAAGLGEKPAAHFLDHGRVAFNEGITFGTGGSGFIRLNFGCPRSVLLDGLNRMKITLEKNVRSNIQDRQIDGSE